MRFLVDMPISPAVAAWLREQGHGAVHAAEIGLARASDEELLGRARTEGRVVMTADLDFGRLLALAAAQGPGVILLRGGNYSERQVHDLIARVLQTVSEQDLGSSMTVVDQRRIRRTRLPLRPIEDGQLDK